MAPVRLLTALLVSSLVVGCGGRVSRGGNGGDDDDDASADDDTTAGDDDTTPGDDDDTTPTGDDDTTPAGDDDTTPSGDDDDNVVQASGTYQVNVDIDQAVYTKADCTSTWTISPTSTAPPAGCPGCFAVFRVDFDRFSDNCDTTIDGMFVQTFTESYGVGGSTLWRYLTDSGDWIAIELEDTTVTSSSFSGDSGYYEVETAVLVQDIFQMTW